MREKYIPQVSIFEYYGEHETGQQLKIISAKLDDCPEIIDIAAKVLIDPKTKDTGRNGLSVDSIVRACLLKQMMGLTYDELSFYIQDSITYNSFARIEAATPSTTSLQACISKIDAPTWEAINRLLLADAVQQNIEKGRMVRIDSTVTETNIHPPTDSSLLWDCIRVTERLLGRLQQTLRPGSFTFSNHTRVAKKLMREAIYLKTDKRKKCYKELLKYTVITKNYLVQGLAMESQVQDTLKFLVLEQEAKRLIALTDRVIDQTKRRVLEGESVPAQEKVFSIFETHTDIVVKGARDIQYGHKLNFTTGKSGLVLDVYVEDGNPADSDKLMPMIERQEDIYGRVPRQAAADGGYASVANKDRAKEAGVKDIAFHKKRGLKILDMVKSEWVYKKLRNFRAGIEGNISCLKRRYGLSRCTWRGLPKFKAYVWASTVAYNLMQLARIETTA
jgi:IS5 family transposase